MTLRKEIMKAIEKANLIYYMNRTPTADKKVADIYEKLIERNPPDRMLCWHCGTQMIWGGDADFEDFGLKCEGIVSNFSCPNCPVTCDLYYTEKK